MKPWMAKARVGLPRPQGVELDAVSALKRIRGECGGRT